MKSNSLRQITRRLRGAPARDSRYTVKDKVLTERLLRTFERDLELANVRGIHFYVKNGSVTLYGTIRHELDRDLLLSLVKKISGVQEVIGHLQIVEQPFQEGQAEITLHL